MSKTLAVLPPALLWAASQCVSTHFIKGPICCIDVRKVGSNIRIVSTDGHRLFRVMFPESSSFYIKEKQTEPLLLNPKAFAKLPKGHVKAVLNEAVLNDGGVCDFYNHSGLRKNSEIWSLPPYGEDVQPYPEVDKLIPADAELTCDPKKFVAFNAAYMADGCRIAERLTFRNNAICLYTTNNNLRPCILRAQLDPSILLADSTIGEIYITYLIMPIQLRFPS